MKQKQHFKFDSFKIVFTLNFHFYGGNSCCTTVSSCVCHIRLFFNRVDKKSINLAYRDGTTTFSITTFGIKTLSTMDYVMPLGISLQFHNAECCGATLDSGINGSERQTHYLTTMQYWLSPF
jgi:hypothetical protein